MRKIVIAAFFGLTLSSCITNKILSKEDDDVYFTKKDRISEDEMREYLKELEERQYEDEEY